MFQENGKNDMWALADTESLSGNAFDQMHYNVSHAKGAVGVSTPWLSTTGSGPGVAAMKTITRTQAPSLTSDGMKRLSQDRQSYIAEVSERARVESAGYRPDLGMVTGSSSPRFEKKAATATSTGHLTSSTDTVHLSPEIYSPLFLTQNLQLPRDRRTANAWNRAFYETNPIVRNAINLHATYPISKLSIKCEDKEVEKFFLDMADRIDLENVVQQASCEFWKMGEAFIYASFDEATGMWDQIYLHNPDYIRVKSSPIPTKTSSIALQPDPELIKIVTSNDPEHIRIREQIDPKILNHVIRNEHIPLDNFNISHLKMLASPYDVRGTSIIVGVWKDLMLYDKLRECKFVQADGMINPITLIKIGTDGPEGLYPRPEELESWRQVFESAQYNKDFKIVTHNAVSIDRPGYNGSLVDVSQDFQLIIDNILMGLMIPKSILTQEGSSYASASVALDVMRQRYNSFRTMMANWLEKKIFAPISEINDFYKLEDKKKRLVVPTVEWNHMTLYDMDNYIGQVSTLVEKQRVSQRTLDRSLGLNRSNELSNIREEMIEKAIMMQEQQALNKMTLAELRALNPEEPIIAPEKQPSGLPGTPGGPGGDMMGDMMGGMGAGGMGLGGMPPMPGGMDLGIPGGLGGGMPPMPGGGGLPGGGAPGGGGGMGPLPGGANPPTPPPTK